MDLFSYLLGKNKGGGSEPTKLQEKEVTITENTTTTITADEGYNGLSSVSVTTDINDFKLYSMYLTFDSIQSNTPEPNSPVDIPVVSTNVVLTIDNVDTTISLGDNEICGIGDIKDKLIIDENGKCYLHKRIGKITFTGNEYWQAVSSPAPDTTRFYYDSDLIYNSQNGSDNTNYILSNRFVGSNWVDIYRDDTTSKNLISNYNNQNTLNGRFVIRADNNIASNTSTFKTFLQNNETIAYYVAKQDLLIDLEQTIDISTITSNSVITNNKNMNMKFLYSDENA